MRDSVFRALGWLAPLAVAALCFAGPPPASHAETPSASGPDSSAAPSPFGAVHDPSRGSFVGGVGASGAAEDDGLPPGWWRDHFALRLRGLEFRDDFVLGTQTLRMRVRGPVVKGAPGLRLELQGFRFGEFSGSFDAYGTARRQGFRLKLRF